MPKIGGERKPVLEMWTVEATMGRALNRCGFDHLAEEYEI